MYNFDPYNVLLAIATNIPVLLMTAFVLQGHILIKVTDMNTIVLVPLLLYTLAGGILVFTVACSTMVLPWYEFVSCGVLQ